MLPPKSTCPGPSTVKPIWPVTASIVVSRKAIKVSRWRPTCCSHLRIVILLYGPTAVIGIASPPSTAPETKAFPAFRFSPTSRNIRRSLGFNSVELGSPAVMSIRTPSQLSQELALVLHNAGVRTGVFTGVALALGFATWLYAANRVPSLENVALERNLIAAIALALIASIPVLRFLRAPGNLLVASLIAWSILAFTYRGLT